MLATLIELQRLKSLGRTGWSLRGLQNGTESVAAHTYGVCVAAMLLADELAARGTLVDSERLLRMALMHDWAETRVGDMPRTATEYFGAEARKSAETAAFKDVTAGVGGIESLYQNIYDEYETRQSLEARLVKAADVIDLLVQVLALERAGARGLDEFWQVATTAHLEFDGPPREVIRGLLQSILDARSNLVTT